MKIINALNETNNFTYSEKEVARFIYNHKEEVLKMSIQELAANTNSSNPTILRVCKKCGCNGFKDFKISLAKDIEELSFEISQINGDIPFSKNDSHIEIAKQLSSLYQDAIRKTYKLMDKNILDRVATLLDSSNTIYLYGRGDCLFPAMSFKNKLIKINKNAIIAVINDQSLFHLHNAKSNDCVIFITYRGSPEYIPFARYLSSKKVPMICITANEKSGICKYANDIIKIAKTEEEKNKIVSFSSIVELEYIFSVLFSTLFSLHYDNNLNYRAMNIKELYDMNIKED